VLVDAIIDDGTVGHGMVFTYTPAALKPVAELIRNFEALVKGEMLAPTEIAQKLNARFRLLGRKDWSASPSPPSTWRFGTRLRAVTGRR
jgi:mandelate racemase